MGHVVCPFCSAADTRVVETRSADPGDAIRRRRECTACGGRFTTYERVEAPPVTIVKRDGRRERFDRQKLLRGLVRAANKRPVSEAQLDELADRIAAELRRGGPEASAEEVGELALRGLARLDPVSGILFASVYRNFTDLAELEAEVRRIKEEPVAGAGQLALEGDAVPSGAGSSIGLSPTDSRSERRGNARQPG